MRRFRSSFIQLLKLRQQQERLAELRLLRDRQAARQATDAATIARQRTHDRSAEYEQQATQPCAIQLVVQARDELAALYDRLEEADRVQHAAWASVDQTMRELLGQRQQREIVERAIDRQREQHRREAQQSELTTLQERACRTSPDDSFPVDAIRTDPGGDAARVETRRAGALDVTDYSCRAGQEDADHA